jgi:hypothetical protein
MTDAGNEAELERARLAYVVELYDRESERKDRLDRRSQFHVSFATALTGAFVLKPDVFKLIHEAYSASSHVGRLALIGSLFGFGAAIFGAMMAILLAVRLQPVVAEYPARTTSKLFDPAQVAWDPGDLAGMLRSFATSYALALEDVTESSAEKRSLCGFHGIS